MPAFRLCVRNSILMASLLTSLNSQSQVHELTSWTLRFPEAQSIRVATTGCYGTASYGYVLPTVDYAQAYRQSLQDVADQNGLRGFVFTSEKDSANNFITVDLETGNLGTVPQVFNAVYKGVVFCQCRTELTHAQYSVDARPNCAHAPALRPLGNTFLATSDASGPSPADDWTDPVTNWQWHFASVASNWRAAMGICTGGYALPDHPTLAHAARRLWDSRLGLRLHAADSRRVWSNEEFDLWSSMAIYIPQGDAGSADKRTLFPVLCVKQ